MGPPCWSGGAVKGGRSKRRSDLLGGGIEGGGLKRRGYQQMKAWARTVQGFKLHHTSKQGKKDHIAKKKKKRGKRAWRVTVKGSSTDS